MPTIIYKGTFHFYGLQFSLTLYSPFSLDILWSLFLDRDCMVYFNWHLGPLFLQTVWSLFPWHPGLIFLDTQAINNMFVSISEDLQPLLPMIYPNCVELPSDLIVLVEDVEKQLMQTRLHKAIGPDQLPNWILKDMTGVIAGPICHLFDSSLRDSYIPTIWTSANICPLTNTKPIINICKDLRPISLTPVLA